ETRNNLEGLHTKNAHSPRVGEEVLAILRCIDCQGRLTCRDDGLACIGCGRLYRQINDVVRFVDAQEYAGSFGFQWKLYSQTQLDNATSQRSERAFRQRTGFQ